MSFTLDPPSLIPFHGTIDLVFTKGVLSTSSRSDCRKYTTDGKDGRKYVLIQSIITPNP